MLPLVLSHELVHPFKFWYHSEICEGMYAGTELYRLCTIHQAEDRQKAFCLALSLSEHGAQVCITAMRNEYKVWVSLRTLPVAALASLEKAIAASGFSLKSVERKVS